MGYWFNGFFLRIAGQDHLSELISSITEQWPQVVCRLFQQPFVGLGVRMTNFTWSASDEKAEEQFALQEELPAWSIQYPSLTLVYLEADCFGGTCFYSGYSCRNGEVLCKEESIEQGPGPLRRLLQQIDMKLEGGYFPPFERNFFGPEQYFRQGHVEKDLEDFLCQNVDLNELDQSFPSSSGPLGEEG